jgi:hypothetical protein
MFVYECGSGKFLVRRFGHCIFLNAVKIICFHESALVVIVYECVHGKCLVCESCRGKCLPKEYTRIVENCKVQLVALRCDNAALGQMVGLLPQPQHMVGWGFSRPLDQCVAVLCGYRLIKPL